MPHKQRTIINTYALKKKYFAPYTCASIKEVAVI